jgi:hypothetical protein
VLVERIGRNRDFDPFAAAGDDRQHRGPGRRYPHIVLQLRHMLLGGRFLRKRPGQHEFRFEDSPGRLDHAVQGRGHPPLHRMKHLPLYLDHDLAGISLKPVPVEGLGDAAELDDQVRREVLRLDFSAFLPPEPEQGDFVIAHDDSGVGAADERAAIEGSERVHHLLHIFYL